MDNQNIATTAPVPSEKVFGVDAVKRLLKDVRQIMKNPLTDNGIYYIHDETNMGYGYAMIVGPENTPYFGGFYFFRFEFPTTYPHLPPTVTFHTNDGLTRFNPNLYENGKVCLSLLNTWEGDKWTSCQTINSVLLSLCMLLNDTPLENEPNDTISQSDIIAYHNIIAYKNIDFSICDMFTHVMSNMLPEFIKFRPYMIAEFMNRYDKLLAFVRSKNNEKTTYRLRFYRHIVDGFFINYEALQDKLIKTYQELQETQEEKDKNKDRII